MSPTEMTRPSRRPLRALLAAAAMSLLAASVAGPASAEEQYDYWSLWIPGANGWEASQVGASDIVLSDKGVIGARYVRTGALLSASDAPRVPADYATLCPDLKPAAGSVRTAVVVDYGEPQLAPEGQATPVTRTRCVSVPATAGGLAALELAAPVTAGPSGFVTAISDYPWVVTALDVSARKAKKKLKPLRRTEVVSGLTTDGTIRKVKVRCYVAGSRVPRKDVSGVCRTSVRGKGERVRVSAKPQCSKKLTVEVRIVSRAADAKRAVWERDWKVRKQPRIACN